MAKIRETPSVEEELHLIRVALDRIADALEPEEEPPADNRMYSFN